MIRNTLFAGCIALGLFVGCSSDDIALDVPDRVDFNYHVRPILSNSCYVCHGPDPSTREADLRLDMREFATAPREGTRRAIVPGSARRSLLIDKITADDPAQRMPPEVTNKVLTPREIAILTRWIDQGAEYKEHWAFIPPEAPPEDLNTGQAIDEFIAERAAQAGLPLAPLAPKETLLRRASYVLTGLPPTPDTVEAFAQDESPDAYATMVDGLLASPAFGERWARHWMDLVRYAEAKGHEFDFTIQGAWQYRDYLIRAFNADVPYDQFLTEHLAGDLLPRPRTHPEEGFNESTIGTAYFALGEGKHSPVDTRIDEAERIDNIIDVTTKTFQGLTVACARCHDHKFDPIPTTDYYSLYGMVESARFAPTPLMDTRYQARLDSLTAVAHTTRQELAEAWLRTASDVPAFPASHRTRSPQAVSVDTTSSMRMLGDFRSGDLDGWFVDGPAFGEGAWSAPPVLSGRQVESVLSGVITSRGIGTGIPGALRSPTFDIAHDTLLVMAAGHVSAIRVVLDNFQLIRAPIHGGLDKEISTPELSPYLFDIGMWKGTKAYIELLVGTYEQRGHFVTEQHLLRLDPESYFDVAYALEYSGERPAVPGVTPGSTSTLAESIRSWAQGEATGGQAHAISAALGSGRLARRAPGGTLRQAGSFEAPPFFIGMADGDTVTSGVFFRGNAKAEEEKPVPHRMFTAIDPEGTPFTRSASGRLDLALAMTDPSNPLTARVMANRLWHHVFGRGIVETVDNFGAQGALPTHPALLDYLALRLIDLDWSIKGLLREIVLSETFQRSTTPPEGLVEADPLNLLLTHFPLRRLEAEAIRDGILAASGRLNPTLYGPPVPIHLTEFMEGRGRPQESGPLDGDGRRSVYIAVRRNFLSPMMLAFDTPIPFSTFGKRNTSNVPAQSLTLLNDPFVAAQAEVWAAELVATPHDSIEERVRAIYVRAFAREPTAAEVAEATEYVQEAAAGMGVVNILQEPAVWAAYCHVVFNMKEFIYLI